MIELLIGLRAEIVQWWVQFGLFAREGFTPATQEQAKQIGARLVDLDELEEALIDAVRRTDCSLPDEEIAL